MKNRNKDIRVRFAPSPTGYFHIGGVRTALFNWLFAKKEGGKFILRIEDTDKERSKSEYEKDILENLMWLGLEWDEGPVYAHKCVSGVDSCKKNTSVADVQSVKSAYLGDYGPYRQSERLEIYEKYLKILFDRGYAYHCFCSEEELEEQRQASLAQGLAPRYSRKCRSLTKSDIEKYQKEGVGSVIRLKAPEIRVSFNDLIRGKIVFDASLSGDAVIAKNLREPLYNFAVVVDDFEMRISHVIRGEEHISNTPTQIIIQKALDMPMPVYAHLPLILNPDRSKMSKRFAATAVREYKEAGYLPNALVNFLALLGWHPREDKEIMSMDELVSEFDISRVQKAGAIFNQQKLDWINAQYIKKISSAKLAEMLNVKNVRVVELFRDRIQRLSDFERLADFALQLPEYDKAILAWKNMPSERIRDNLESGLELIRSIGEKDFNKENLIKILMELADKIGRGELLWPLRVALSGKEESPGPFEIMDALGKAETILRVEKALEKLESQ